MAKTIVPARIENLENMIAFIRKGVESVGLTKKELNQVHLVCEETLLNIINYAYPDKTGDIEISYQIDTGSKEITLQFCDGGVPFNPLSVPEPDVDAPIEERDVGGLGIFLVRKIMQDVQYRRQDDKNILTLTKKY